MHMHPARRYPPAFYGVICIIICAINGCGNRENNTSSQVSASSTESSQQKINEPLHNNSTPLGNWAWGNQGPQAGTLIEAQNIDETRHLFEDGLYDQTQESLTKLFAKGCEHPLAFYLQAQVYAQRGQLEQATPWCDKAIASSPWWVEPRILLAQCYITLKKLAAAETVFIDIDHLAPKSPWGPYGQGSVALMRGDRERSVIHIDEALLRDPRHTPSLRLRIDLAHWLKQHDIEEQLLARYLHEDADAAWAHVRLGELAVSASRLDDARRAFLRAYDLQPDRDVAQHLADLAQRRNDAAEIHYWQERAGTAESASKP